MLINITDGLKEHYPQYSEAFQINFQSIASKLVELQEYGESALSELSCRDLITFHDGFAYFAESFNLHILEAIEEESGSEASAAEIKHLIGVVREHNLPAVFIEKSGSDACAGIIHAETGIGIYTLDMAMSGNSYFDAMYHNINTIKEALE
jgi:ABC-type Zn uptake system ZnuABC Zn-binding protein ZnuA